MNIMTSAGYKSSKIEDDHGKLADRGYMMSPKDWKNVEMTVYFQFEGGNAQEQFVLYCRGGTHTGNHGCEGFAYKADIQYNNGETRFAKEQWHVSYEFTNWKDKLNIGNTKGHYTGMKFIAYNINKDKAVKLELWVDTEGDNVWRKADEFVDDGGFGNKDDCGGDKDQIGTWGGPFATLRLDDADIRFKKFSVREIDISATDPDQNPNPDPEPTPTPTPTCPAGQHLEGSICVPDTEPLPTPGPTPTPTPTPNPNPPPPATGTLVFANFTGVYNINFDESSGCSGLLVDANPLKIIYNVPQDAIQSVNSTQPLGNGTVSRCGQHFFSNQSNMVDPKDPKKFKRVSLFLSKQGNPTGLINIYMRSGLNDSIKVNFGQIDALSLSENPSFYDFENLDNTYGVDNDDKLSIEYAGGNATNYVKVSKNSSDPEDGSNSRFFRFETPNWWPMAADDLAGVFYVESKTEEENV